ncbi:MAG: outer membrane protein assembly factor BamA, partial [Muribaculaceae bacterium]|nr:outer membrane protein assembly factor BamA [Muribaculaceae bacterium]
MRYKILIALGLLAAAFGSRNAAVAQQTADTVYNPQVLYNSMPRTYEIVDIAVTGAPNYDSEMILNVAGIRVGDRVQIPGAEMSDAIKRLMRHGLFSQAQARLVKTAGNKAWIELALRPQPRISEVNYLGMKKGEREDLQEKLQLMKGNSISQNIVNRTKAIVKKYFADKGFGNAEVFVDLRDDLSHPNEVFVDISVDKHSKVKVHKIYIEGNEVLSDNQLQRTMKKTNENGKILNLFKQKKFVENDYHDDLNRIIEKYNEKGYRDAKIVADSVVPYNEKMVDVYIDVDEGRQYYIKDITWV